MFCLLLKTLFVLTLLLENTLLNAQDLAMHPESIIPLSLSKDQWRKRLTREQYEILREEGTEPAGSSVLDHEKRKGFFVCAGCNLALFESRAKYDSGTGWPSFWTFIPGRLETKLDFSPVLGSSWPRTEYHCARCDGHQGHVFDDGPKPTGKRYCNNGLALKFVPQKILKSEPENEPEKREAIFAGGCFWCMEPPFDKLPGVLKTISGYTGGNVNNPTYEQVSGKTTGHYEAVKVTYNPVRITYADLLRVYWVNIDPFDGEGQFCDKGTPYLSAVFYQTDAEKKAAEQSLVQVEQILRNKSKKPIQTKILKKSIFFTAEDYHQDYAHRNPLRYRYYRHRCGRDSRLQEVWGTHKSLARTP